MVVGTLSAQQLIIMQVKLLIFHTHTLTVRTVSTIDHYKPPPPTTPPPPLEVYTRSGTVGVSLMRVRCGLEMLKPRAPAICESVCDCPDCPDWK